MADGHVGHFQFWRSRAAAMPPITVTVKGQFGGMKATLLGVEMLGNPVQKWKEPVNEEYKHVHLVGYALEEVPQSPPFQAKVHVSNQLIKDTELWLLGPPRLLLVPALKSHDDRKPTQDVTGPHFLCYRVQQAPPMPRTVDLIDQFHKQQVSDLRPAYLGVPVDKNGEGHWNEKIHLAMYEFRGFEFDPPKVVYTTDQFAHRQLHAHISFLLGVPSGKTVSG